MKYILKDIKQFYISNISVIIIIILSVIAGIILSVLCFNILTEESKQELTNCIQELNNSLKNKEYTINIIDISINTLIETGIFTLVLLILGSSVIFNKLIYLLFVFKGYCLGTCFSTNILLMGNIKGTIYSLILLLLPYTIFILFEIILTLLWYKFANDILIDKRYYNIKRKLINNIVLTLIIYLLMLIILIFNNFLSSTILIYYINII